MDATVRGHLSAEVGGDRADIAANIEACHTGTDASVDIPMEGLVVVPECNDREVQMVAGMEPQLGSPAVPPPAESRRGKVSGREGAAPQPVGDPVRAQATKRPAKVDDCPEQGSVQVHRGRVPAIL